jgi:hypothetical protein
MVGDDELLAAVALLKVIIEALALHPPGDKIEVRLLVLADVLLRLVLVVELERVVVRREARVLEDVLDDVGHALLREDVAVERLRERPELRHERGPEERPAAELLHEIERGEDSVEDERGPAVVPVHRERGLRVDGVGHVELARLLAREDDKDLERVRP